MRLHPAIVRALPPKVQAALPCPPPLLKGINAASDHDEAALARNALGVTYDRPEGPFATLADADGAIARCRSGGLKALSILDTSKPTVSASIVAKYGPSSLGGYTWFELGNEPYEPGTWIDPAMFALQVVATVNLCMAADPKAKFLLPAAPDVQPGGPPGPWHAWADLLYLAVPDLHKYYDARALHPYGPTDRTGQTDTGGGWQTIPITDAAFAAHEPVKKSNWITEIGANLFDVNQVQQGVLYDRWFTDAKKPPWPGVQIDAIFPFCWKDYSEKFGVVNDDTTPRPAATIIKNA